MRPNDVPIEIEAALAWCDKYGDRDGDGFVEYFRETPNGLANQGWKDSQDSIFHANGKLARGPIALCEVQGYVYAAKHGMARLAGLLGHDAMAERLADAGDGNHAYIDTPEEARKVLVEQMQATLLTIANDVKVQIEFNPAQVAEYRLIGYENRMLAQEDFANDRVDAGDIGAGHEVTALYEIALAGSGGERLPPLRYAAAAQGSSARDGELAHLRLRYKLPGQERSRLIETPVLRSSLQPAPGASLRFAAAVAAYADLLRGGTNVEGWDWDDVAASARATLGEDRWGLRRELVELVESARKVTSAESTAAAAIAAD